MCHPSTRFWLIFLVFLGGCVPHTPLTPIEIEREKSPTAIAQESLVVPATPLIELTVTISPTPLPETSTPLPSPDINGQLFVYDSLGMARISLSTGETTYLFKAEEEWLDWGASFAQNQKQAVYWIRREKETEVWFSFLPQWNPQLVLTFENQGYEFVIPSWGANDKYLILEIGYEEDTALKDRITIGSYILDIETMGWVTSSIWPGNCPILAPSPQTGMLALWCKNARWLEDADKFLVLEKDYTPWFTQELPIPLTDECMNEWACAWSPNGQFVVFDELFYSAIYTPSLIPLMDPIPTYFAFLRWSGDSQNISYLGGCLTQDLNGSHGCPTAISIQSREVVWRLPETDDAHRLGDVDVGSVISSPDGHFIAFPATFEGEEGILIDKLVVIDPKTEQILLKIDHPIYIADLVWVDP